jgi:hypothetical protein
MSKFGWGHGSQRPLSNFPSVTQTKVPGRQNFRPEFRKFWRLSKR